MTGDRLEWDWNLIRGEKQLGIPPAVIFQALFFSLLGLTVGISICVLWKGHTVGLRKKVNDLRLPLMKWTITVYNCWKKVETKKANIMTNHQPTSLFHLYLLGL